MNQDDISELKRQFKEQANWGFVSRYGRTGRIQSVEAEGKMVQVETPRGLLQARVGEGTAISKTEDGEERTLTFEDLTPGMLVTVSGQTEAGGATEASKIEVIPEGEGGFDIRPHSGEGPVSVPVFP